MTDTLQSKGRHATGLQTRLLRAGKLPLLFPALGFSATVCLAPASLLIGCGNAAGRASLAGGIAQNAHGIFLTAASYRSAVLRTNPLAYFPFDSAKEGSIVNGYSANPVGGAAIAKGGAIKSNPKDAYLLLSGSGQYVTTTVWDGIPGTASIVAWVNLATLPSAAGHFFDIAAESQAGNDFDLQFQTDNALYFYTGAGENTSYTPPPSSLVGQWNMVAVTYRGGQPPHSFRKIYWNGTLVASFQGAVDSASKESYFSIGASLVWSGRFFDGGIDDLALWNRALKSSEIATIYNAAQ